MRKGEDGTMTKKRLMQFRVTDVERSLARTCAIACGMSVSEYVRACLVINIVEALEESGITIGGGTTAEMAKEIIARQVLRVGSV